MTAERRYHRDKDAVACVLEDITLLYHRASGQTHMMISPVPEILDALDEEADATAAQLHARLERHYDLGEPEQAIAELEAHLESLTALGLVCRS
ncbi:HPr-rel-A system PqqD family peptide chaperone [Sphingobium sp. TomMM35A]